MMPSRTIRLISGFAAGTALVALACQENITAPGVCPDFCPPSTISVLDTLLLANVNRDSTFSGYQTPGSGFNMQIASPGGGIESRGMIRFARFPTTILSQGTDARDVVETDSFQVNLTMRSRNELATGLQVRVYRIPLTVDSTTTFTDTDPYFADSALIGVTSVPDSVIPDSTDRDTISVVFPASALPSFQADSLNSAVGISVVANSGTFVNFGTIEGGETPIMVRYAKADSGGTLVERSDQRVSLFDSFVRSPGLGLMPDALFVGGAPSSRSLLRLNIPSAILDSSEIVGAKLLLVPLLPAAGAPADTFRIQANALGADFGPKSPVIIVGALTDTTALRGAAVAVGSSDTVAVDITAVLQDWQANPSRPRSLMVRASPEAITLGELLFGSSRSAGAIPSIRLTYVPPFDFR